MLPGLWEYEVGKQITKGNQGLERLNIYRAGVSQRIEAKPVGCVVSLQYGQWSLMLG
jgi:hypothetical protein